MELAKLELASPPPHALNESLPVKNRTDFSSKEAYFQHLASDVSDLKKELALNDKILDEVDESGNTLLHLVADNTNRDFAFAVQSYLTDARVGAQNRQGDTVLHVHVKYMHDSRCWQQTIPIYLEHSNGGATLSIPNHDGDTSLFRFFTGEPWDPYQQRPSVSDYLVRRRLPNLDFNAPCTNGLTVLSLTIALNKYDEALKLIGHGAVATFHGTDEKFSTRYVVEKRKEVLNEQLLTKELVNKDINELMETAQSLHSERMKLRMQKMWETVGSPDFHEGVKVEDLEEDDYAVAIALKKLALVEDKLNFAI